MVHPDDEIYAITSAGGVIRTRAGEVKRSSRQTMGVRLMNLASGDSIVGLARNAESIAAAALSKLARDGAFEKAKAQAAFAELGVETEGVNPARL